VRPGEEPVAPPQSQSIDATVLLIGDAGLPRLEGTEPVLEALRVEASRDAERTVVVFLGDNIYPDGMPPEADSGRPRAEAILRRQAEAVGAARGIFIPGNHDYHAGRRDSLRRQAEALARLGNPRITFLPRGGCPGPDVVDAGTRIRLVLLDSQWWLDPEIARTTPSDCAASNEQAIVTAVAAALDTTRGRSTLLLAHHPPATHGVHGGHFDWRDHLFPLSRAVGWLWIPLPGLGSLYPLVRGSGAVGQDLAASRYEHMVARLDSACAAHPPLAWAGGHDHSLQVLAGTGPVPYVLVSGAGSIARPDPLARAEDTMLASPRAGFMRLDALRDGRIRLEVIEVLEDGSTERPWSAWLAAPGVPTH
jgi:calcineurin-like phosphoesterase family protein